MRRATFARLAAAAGVAAVVGPAGAQAAKLRLITTPSDSGAEAYYALELGFFKNAGLEVEVQSLTNGAAVAAAVASGSAEIGQGNLVSLAAAHERGLPFVLLAPASMYAGGPPTSALIVPKTSTVASARDLIGKTVAGAGLKDIGSVALDMWLLQNGVTPDQIRFVEMPSAQIEGALERGTVSAAILIEPYLSGALAANARLLASTQAAIAKRFLIGAYFATAEWTKAHAETAKRFGEAIVAAARWANANHARSAQILERYGKARVTPTQVRTSYAESLDPALMQPLIDASARDGVITSAFPAAALLPA